MENTLQFRPTKIVVNLEAIKANVRNLRSRLNEHVQIIAVVKANAYGHGDVNVARAALEAGASMLAVATPEEAVHIRKHFPHVGILVLGASPIQFAEYASVHNITLTVFSTDWINQLPHLEQQLKLHMKIDSGMGRIGVTNEKQLLQLYESIVKRSDLEMEGVFTHFATADEEDTAYFDNQIEKFMQLLSVLPKKPKMVHVANTATALIKSSTYHFDAVRYGISMYGLAPSSYVEKVLPFDLQPALTLETELVHVKKLEKGEAVGYGASFITNETSYIGTVPIGYADGMIRKLSGIDVLIGGKRAPIIGRICMDQCMILLPKAYNIGERVVLIGNQEDESISIDEWAEKLGTINYEIPCILTQRIPRFYK
jgi:alanine racemase